MVREFEPSGVPGPARRGDDGHHHGRTRRTGSPDAGGPAEAGNDQPSCSRSSALPLSEQRLVVSVCPGAVAPVTDADRLMTK